MNAASSAIVAGGVPRTLPRLSEVIREEGRIMMPRMVQGRPYVGTLIFVAVIWLFRDSVASPVVLGMIFPLNAWQDRIMGRATLWERPTRRRTGNNVRHLTALAYTLGAVGLVVLLDASARRLGILDSAEQIHATTLAGGAILVFTMITIMGQFLNERRKYLLPMVAALAIPLLVLPSRIYLRFLPDFLHPLLIGRYGLDLFGRGFFSTTGPGLSVSDWSLAAALWLPCCLLAVLAVASIHHE